MVRTLFWLTSLVSVAFFASAAHAVKLEYRVKSGDQWKQKLMVKGDGVMESDGRRFDMIVESSTTVTTRVKSVASDGSFVSIVEFVPGATRVVVNGVAMPQRRQQIPRPLTITTSKLGKPIRIDGLEAEGGARNLDMARLLGFTTGLFPDHEVNPGDSWDGSPDPAVLPMKIGGKLVSLRRVGGKETAEVEYTFQMPAAGLAKMLKQAADAEVEISGGGISGASSGTIDAITGIPGPGKGTAEMDLIVRAPNGQRARQTLKLNITIEAVY